VKDAARQVCLDSPTHAGKLGRAAQGVKVTWNKYSPSQTHLVVLYL